MEFTKQPEPIVGFSKAERMAQMSAIDREIVNLMKSSGRAIKCLGQKVQQDGDVNVTGTEADPIQEYKESMEEFMRTLRTVNVGMKRQIWGLEEAGVISLDKKEPAIREEGGEIQASSTRNGLLEPDGNGRIGGIEVGWLNSRSNKVEKDMEADLWQETGVMLRQLIEHQRDPDHMQRDDKAS